MAEENGAFDNTIEKLGKATKKPSQPKATMALAVQIVDKTGKPVEDGGSGDGEGLSAAETAAAEEEDKKSREKQSGFLGKIAGGVTGMFGKMLEKPLMSGFQCLSTGLKSNPHGKPPPLKQRKTFGTHRLVY